MAMNSQLSMEHLHWSDLGLNKKQIYDYISGVMSYGCIVACAVMPGGLGSLLKKLAGRMVDGRLLAMCADTEPSVSCHVLRTEQAMTV